MSFLLDTNAISERTFDRPDQGLIAWLSEADENLFHVSALTIAELRRGALRLGPGAKRRALETFIGEVVEFYSDRIVPIDLSVAERWAELAHAYKAAGVVVGLVDELIAATALAYDLTLVTRNTRHFADSGCKLLCPWSAGSRD